MNEADAQNYPNPFLNKDEKVVEGIEVITYDPNGKEFEMVFKIWVSKTRVLTAGGNHSFLSINRGKTKTLLHFSDV